MQLAKIRLFISLIIAVAIVTFVLTGTTPTKVSFNFVGNAARLSASIVIFLSIGVGFVLGYLFRISRLVRRKAPKKPES